MKRIIAALALTLGLMFVLAHRLALTALLRPWSWPRTNDNSDDDKRVWGFAGLLGLVALRA